MRREGWNRTICWVRPSILSVRFGSHGWVPNRSIKRNFWKAKTLIVLYNLRKCSTQNQSFISTFWFASLSCTSSLRSRSFSSSDLKVMNSYSSDASIGRTNYLTYFMVASCIVFALEIPIRSRSSKVSGIILIEDPEEVKKSYLGLPIFIDLLGLFAILLRLSPA